MSRTATAYCLLVIACATAQRAHSCGSDALAVSATSDAAASCVKTAPDAVVSARSATEEFLAGRLAFWQQRLKLEEWKVTIVMTSRAGLKAGTLGGIKWDKAKKTAVMAVLDSSDYTGSTEEMLKDMEFTVVHELIHLELASLPRSEASRRTEERAVNNLALALLGLHRAK